MSINPLLDPGRVLLEYSNGCNLRAFPQGYTSHFASVSDVSSDDVNWSQIKIAQTLIESCSRQIEYEWDGQNRMLPARRHLST